MTAPVKTPVFFLNSTGRKTGFEDRELCTTAGHFARLMEQAARAPDAESRKVGERTPADAEKDSEADDISNEQGSPEDQNAATGPPPSWLAGMPVTVFGQPIPVNTQPAQAEAQDPSALPEHSGLAAGTPTLAHDEKNVPTAERLNAIGKLLGVRVEDLLGEPIGDVSDASGTDVQFFREYAGMSEDEKKRYRDAMKLMFGNKDTNSESA